MALVRIDYDFSSDWKQSLNSKPSRACHRHFVLTERVGSAGLP
jgi:hypothetical protein